MSRSALPDLARVGWLGHGAYAHRGLHGDGRVENSPAAFAAAIAAGLGIECDVQLSSDGAAMVFHDWTLERLTTQTGEVRAKAAAELGQIRLGATADTIPTLPQLLDQVDGKVPLLIEIKSRRDVDFLPLCRAVDQALMGYSGKVAIMSFDPRVVRWFGQHAPQIVRGLVMTEEHDHGWRGELRRRMFVRIAAPEFMAYDVRDLPSRFAARQRARGLPLLTWTVRSAELLATQRAHADAPIAEGPAMALL